MAIYQYETSPRKIVPEYSPKRTKKVMSEKEELKKEIKKKAKQNVRLNNAIKIRRKKLVLTILVAFIILLVISYRNSLINESFSKVKSLKNELSTIEKENEQLQVNIESSLNLKNIEQTAKEKLGMQRLEQDQKIYVSLPKKDYIEPVAEVAKTEEKTSIIQKILKFFKGE